MSDRRTTSFEDCVWTALAFVLALCLLAYSANATDSTGTPAFGGYTVDQNSLSGF